MYQNNSFNVDFDSLLHNFTMQQYNDLLGKLGNEHNLVSGPLKAHDELIFSVQKDVVKKNKTFRHFSLDNLSTPLGKNKILIVFTCFLAGSKVASIQEPSPHSVYTGKGSQTNSFADNPGVLADRQNEWLKQATLYMGIVNPTRIRGTSVKV